MSIREKEWIPIINKREIVDVVANLKCGMAEGQDNVSTE